MEDINFNDYIWVTEASKILGVNIVTLRRWEKQGKIKVYRHPVTKWRLYKKDEIEAMLEKFKNERKQVIES